MRRLSWTGLLVVLLLALPAAASGSASRLAHSRSAAFFYPQLAGNSVVVGAYRRHSVNDLIRLTPGERAQRLRRVRGMTWLRADATPTRVLAWRYFESGAGRLLGGPLAGPLQTLESCPQAAQLVGVPPPAVDGDLSVWAGEGCVRDTIRVQLGTAGHTIPVTGGFVENLAAGGRYAAWTTDTPSASPQVPDAIELTVYDAQAGAVAYTTPVPASGAISVDANGTTVLQQGVDFPCSRSQARLVYYTIAEPVAHALPFASCSPEVKIVAGRIAFLEQDPGHDSQLAITDTAAATPQVLARFREPRAADNGFDFDGSRVAWAQTRCRDSAVFRRDVSDGSPPEPAVTCPVRVGSPRLGRDGTLHVRVACPHGCLADPRSKLQGIELIAPHWLHVMGRRHGVTRFAPFVKFSLRPGRHTVVHLPLTRRQRSTLRRHRHVRVRLKVVLQAIYRPRIIRTARAR